MISASKEFADACKAAGVQTVVRVSSLRCGGLLKKDGTKMLQGPLGEAHVAGEAYMTQIGLTVTSVRPTSFSSNFEKYDLESVRMEGKFFSPLGLEVRKEHVLLHSCTPINPRTLCERDCACCAECGCRHFLPHVLRIVSRL